MSVKLKDIFSKPISGEWGDEPDEKDFVKIIKTNNILNTGRINYNNITLRKIDHKTVELKKLQYGDILIEKSGGSPANPVGRVCFFENNNEVYLTNNFMSTLRVANEYFYHQYIFYAMYFLYKKRVVLNFQNQTTGIINLKLDRYLSTIKIKQVDLAKQIEIAKALHKAQELIELRKFSIEKLDELSKAIFIDMFGDPVKNPKKLKEEKLENLGNWKSGGTPSRSNAEYFKGDINWFTAGELNTLYVDNSIEKITDIAVKESSAKLFKKNTLLIGMYDTAAFKMSILKKDSASNQAITNIDHYENKVEVLWLFYALQLKKDVYLNSRRGVRQQNLSLTKIKNFTIILPDIKEQKKFSQTIEKIEFQKSLYEAELTGLQATFDALLSQSFEG